MASKKVKRTMKRGRRDGHHATGEEALTHVDAMLARGTAPPETLADIERLLMTALGGRQGRAPLRADPQDARHGHVAAVAKALRGASAPGNVPLLNDVVAGAQLVLRVELKHVQPAVWREIVVDAASTLADLHDVIQASMGWHGSHLHVFTVGGQDYGPPMDDDAYEAVDEGTASLAGLGSSSFGYLYDFGDTWEHSVAVKKVLASSDEPVPRCSGGARACPPEDCGGPPGYQELLEDVEAQGRPRSRGRLFDPENFSLTAANRRLAALGQTYTGVVAFTYTAHDGRPWFLHHVLTVKGKPRLFMAKTQGSGALREMPPGFEVVESINGVVSVARTASRQSNVRPADVETVRAALRAAPDTMNYGVEVHGDAIIINEPVGASRPRFTPVMMFELLESGEYQVSRMTYRGAGGWHTLTMGTLKRMLARYLPHLGKESFFTLM